MTSVVYSPTAQRIRGFNSDDDFSFVIVETPLGIAGGTVAGESYEAITLETTTTGAANNFRIDTASSLASLNSGETFTSLTPDIASVDSDGNVSILSETGGVRIAIKSGGIERRYGRTPSLGGSVVTTAITEYKAGSLGKAVSDEMAAILANSTTAQGNVTGLGGTQNRLSACNYSLTDPTATANPDFFARYGSDGTTPISWAAVSIINELGGVGGYGHPPVLVTARHVFSARHYHAPVGSNVTFMRDDGTLQTATILSAWATGPGTTDHWIGYLDQEITGITPMELMPSNWYEWTKSICYESNIGDLAFFGRLPIFSKGVWTPNGLSSDRVSVTYLTSLGGVVGYAATATTAVGHSMPSDSPDFAWYAQIRGGDSGSPAMMLVNGKLVLLFCHWTMGGGRCISAQASNLETQMRVLAAAQGDGVNYVFARADLSGFTKY